MRLAGGSRGWDMPGRVNRGELAGWSSGWRVAGRANSLRLAGKINHWRLATSCRNHFLYVSAIVQQRGCREVKT